ncbi:adenosylcobinamide amidohydrolase [Hyphomicrobium sp. 99]|uniref:adenosylcobinamide amidohydrolase n=1 Tax=Hyphomicrobium sp. 99 TaxID=1163419 RepID=UPI0009E260BE|nr:adenosylcobinamide amidohydrolase [Hyphomicrobium sp. 99]
MRNIEIGYVSGQTDERTEAHATTSLNLPFVLTHQTRILLANFDEPQRMLSWSLTKPGFQIARQVAWIELRDADLPADQDAEDVIASRIAKVGLTEAVSLITSRDISRHHVSRVAVEDTVAACISTVGLSNGERVGQRFAPPGTPLGTINTMVHASVPLSDAALIEAITIAAEARTAAILDSEVRRSGVAITGTGTDCIIVAAPLGGSVRFAGLHTAAGEAIGAAVYNAIRDGIAAWLQDTETMQLAVGIES